MLRRMVFAFFDLLYGRLAVCYDPVAWLVSRGAWPDWVLAARPYLAGEVLEIGSGTGHLLAALGIDERFIIGLDRSRPLLTRARRRLRSAGLSERLVQGRAGALPFAEGTFDCVVTTFPAPFAADPEVMREIRRVLMERGEWVIVDGAYPGGSDLWSRAARWLLVRLAPPSDGRRPSLVERLQDAGFAVDALQVAVGPDSVTVLRARGDLRL